MITSGIFNVGTDNLDTIRDLTADGMLQAGPPYPKEDVPKVKMLQQA